MEGGRYKFPAAQAEFLRALKDGRYRSAPHAASLPPSFSLEDAMPPPGEQAMRGTCVAAAAVAMLEYRGDCKTRLSVQFLDAATKRLERKGVEKCLADVRAGRETAPAFERAFGGKLAQLRMLAQFNGGFGSEAMKPWIDKFEAGVLARLEPEGGSLLRSCFRVLREEGVCRHSLWPYAAAPSGRAEAAFPAEFPPGAEEDAAKRRISHGLYMLPAANNVEEIKGIVSGANARRPMPVCVTADYFEGCDSDGFSFPRTEEDGEGGLVSLDARKGIHCVDVIGYETDARAPGGGFFIVRNSWGAGWGRNGSGRMPFAYLECFAHEAGTVLEDMVDYAGDGYGGLRASGAAVRKPRGKPRARAIAIQLAAAGAVVAGAVAATLFFAGARGTAPEGEGKSAETAQESPRGRRLRALKPIPADGGAPVKCEIRIFGAERGVAHAAVVRLLPDVKITAESDDWNDTLRMDVSRTRFKKLAMALQSATRSYVCMTNRGRAIEVTGPGSARELELQTDSPKAVRKWMAETPEVRAKVLKESDFGLTVLTYGREKFLHALAAGFSVKVDDGDNVTVRMKDAKEEEKKQ